MFTANTLDSNTPQFFKSLLCFYSLTISVFMPKLKDFNDILSRLFVWNQRYQFWMLSQSFLVAAGVNLANNDNFCNGGNKPYEGLSLLVPLAGLILTVLNVVNTSQAMSGRSNLEQVFNQLLLSDVLNNGGTTFDDDTFYNFNYSGCYVERGVARFCGKCFERCNNKFATDSTIEDLFLRLSTKLPAGVGLLIFCCVSQCGVLPLGGSICSCF